MRRSTSVDSSGPRRSAGEMIGAAWPAAPPEYARETPPEPSARLGAAAAGNRVVSAVDPSVVEDVGAASAGVEALGVEAAEVDDDEPDP